MPEDFDTAAWNRWLTTAPRTIHMIGIGGVGMAGLAHILSAAGHRVSGTELVPNVWTDQLRKEGLSIHVGHDPKQVPAGVELCIHTTAVRPDHPEALRALAAGAARLRRGQVLAAVSRRSGSLAVSGTHGKTTTTSMIHFLLSSCGPEPDYFIGAQPSHCDRIAGWRGREVFCFEADESDGTLVHYEPETAVITNIDFDHMEHHADAESFYSMFQTFADRTQQTLILPDRDPQVQRLKLNPELQRLSFGFGEEAGMRAHRLVQDAESVSFTLQADGKDLGRFRLGVPGLHNLRNALAALAALKSLKLDVGQAAEALGGYRAAERRMETLVRNRDLQVLTDYAHHPSEIAAVLDTVEGWPAERTVVVFQPHRYTRTLALKKDFGRVLSRADILLLLPVYAASEEPVEGGRVEDLELEVRSQTAAPVVTLSELSDLATAIEDVQRPGDLILFLGAGDLDSAAREIAGRMNEKGVN